MARPLFATTNAASLLDTLCAPAASGRSNARTIRAVKTIKARSRLRAFGPIPFMMPMITSTPRPYFQTNRRLMIARRIRRPPFGLNGAPDLPA